MDYAKYVNEKKTPQSQPIPGSAQVANSAGGYAWAVDDWTRLDRFLILGAEGATFLPGAAFDCVGGDRLGTQWLGRGRASFTW